MNWYVVKTNTNERVIGPLDDSDFDDARALAESEAERLNIEAGGQLWNGEPVRYVVEFQATDEP